MSDKELTEYMRLIRLCMTELQRELPRPSFCDELHPKYNNLAVSTDALASRLSAMGLIDLESVCASGEAMNTGWRAINSIADAPPNDCMVAFTVSEEECPGEDIGNPSNISASVGFLSWSRDKTFFSITESGETICAGNVTALCPLPYSKGVIAGNGAKLIPQSPES